jgi:CubicO group peptidase (beta-lactamase class C family)
VPRDSAIADGFGPAGFHAADEIVRRASERGVAPGISYGIVRDGKLVHAAGFGERSLGGPVSSRPVPGNPVLGNTVLGNPVLGNPVLGNTVPDERTVFRIASMSKSFTASAVLLLRDEGALSLDDPAGRYLSELAGWVNGAADAGPLTIRRLLTMTAGFPTDDPWGDRQQGLPLDEFRALLAGGVGFNWAPGTRFEYSNLGYAILGLIVTAASGVPYDSFIRTRLLEPLGMTRTGFAAEEFPADELAVGYRRGPDGWQELPFDPYGAFAPMGGVFSCVADLATWCAGFAAAFPPDGPVLGSPVPGSPVLGSPVPGSTAAGAVNPDPGHPLAAASRREMQLPQAVTGWRAPDRLPGGPLAAPSYYGFGLFVDEDPAVGRIVSHSGGYPGFGSNMRWHPATSLAVITLGNGTYTPMASVADLVLRSLLTASADSHVALAPVRSGAPDGATGPAAPDSTAGGPWPETLAAADAVSSLLRDWDDAAADALFSPNVALDRPYAERRADLALLESRIGPFTVDAGRAAESDTPAHRRWFLAGEHGTVAVAIQLNPQRPPRVQSLTFAVPPAPGSVLAQALQTVTDWLNGWLAGGAADWPAALPVAPEADADLIARRLRMAAAWAGPVTPGAYRTGDGLSAATVELAGQHAPVTLSLAVNSSTGALRQADVTLLPLPRYRCPQGPPRPRRPRRPHRAAGKSVAPPEYIPIRSRSVSIVRPGYLPRTMPLQDSACSGRASRFQVLEGAHGHIDGSAQAMGHPRRPRRRPARHRHRQHRTQRRAQDHRKPGGRTRRQPVRA